MQRRAHRLVVEEHLLHAQCRSLVVDEDVGFEIVLEGTEVDIRGAAGRQRVVAHNQLGMDEPRVIEVDVGSGMVQLAQIGA